MSIQEKRIIVNIFTTVLVSYLYFRQVYVHYFSAHPERLDDFSFWAKVFLIFIVVSVVSKIIMHILASIAFAIMNGGKEVDEPSKADERDKLIELKSQYLSSILFSLGVVFAMVALVLNIPQYSMFIVLFAFGMISDIAGESAKFIYYRRGF